MDINEKSFTERMLIAYPVLFSDYLQGRSIEGISKHWEASVERMCAQLSKIPSYRIYQIKKNFVA